MERKIIFLVILFSVLTIAGSYFLLKATDSQTKLTKKVVNYQREDKERPKIEVKNNFSDLGQMKVSQEKSADFIVKNVGQKPLQLFNISSSCGCTVAQVIIDGKKSEEFGMHSQSDYIGEVLPGKEGKVRVIYRPFVMPVYGPVEREVYLSTNDPQTPKLTFKVKAFVK